MLHPTRLQVLLEAVRNPGARIVDVAERVGLTHQAISAHVKRLEAEGLVEGGRGVRATADGVQALHEALLEVRSFTERAERALDLAALTEATAGEALEAGDAVHLVMDQGRLTAHPGPGDCTATARTTARGGEPVLVDGLEGVVPHEQGSIRVLEVPQAPTDADLDQLHRRLEELDPGIVGVIGPVAEHAAAQDPVDRPLVALGAPEAVVEGALRGLDAVLLATQAGVREAFRRLVQARERWGAAAPVELETLRTEATAETA